MPFKANLHTRWLHDPVFEALSDKALRVYYASLQFAVEQGNNGRIARVSLRHLHPDGVGSDTLSELIDSGLWESHGDAIQIRGYDVEQPTREQMEKYTTEARRRKQKQRAGQRAESHEDMSHVTGTRDDYSLTNSLNKTATEVTDNWPTKTPGGVS